MENMDKKYSSQLYVMGYTRKSGTIVKVVVAAVYGIKPAPKVDCVTLRADDNTSDDGAFEFEGIFLEDLENNLGKLFETRNAPYIKYTYNENRHYSQKAVELFGDCMIIDTKEWSVAEFKRVYNAYSRVARRNLDSDILALKKQLAVLEEKLVALEQTHAEWKDIID